MSHKLRVGSIVLLLVQSLVYAASPKHFDDLKLAAELRGNTQALLDAIAPGDVAVWARLLDKNALYVDENDIVHTKTALLAEFKPLPPGLVGHLKVDSFALVRHGAVAVVTHEDAEYLDYHGQVIRSRFRNTDTWVRERAGWRLLGSQVLAVPIDPPSQKLSDSQMCQYDGQYQLTAEIGGRIKCYEDHLIFQQTGKSDRDFHAEVTDVFFEPGEPRTRRIFKRDDNGRITGFVDRREGRDIVWTRDLIDVRP